MASLPFKLDIRIFRGATFARKVSWLKKDGTPAVDLSLFNAKLTLRPRNARQGRTVVLTGINGLAINATEGSVTFTLTAAQTAALMATSDTWGTYELILTPKSGAEPVYALVYGDVNILGGE